MKIISLKLLWILEFYEILIWVNNNFLNIFHPGGLFGSGRRFARVIYLTKALFRSCFNGWSSPDECICSLKSFLPYIHGTPVIPPKIIERLSYQMLFFKCRQWFIKNAKIWRLFSLRNKNKNKSCNLALKSGNAAEISKTQTISNQL